MENAAFTIHGLHPDSPQADIELLHFYSKLGVQSHFTEDGSLTISRTKQAYPTHISYHLKHNIDLAPALISTCAYLRIPAVFIGISNLKHKESDRLLALQENLRTFGVSLSYQEDQAALSFVPNFEVSQPVQIRSYQDHRIAMACSVFALKYQLSIDKPDCVVKSFPGFWEQLQSLNFEIN